MRFHRLPVKDPRTVARDIPGICDLLFPQLLPSIVTYLNRQADSIIHIEAVPDELVARTSIKAAMLFEVAYARAEQILNGKDGEDWADSLKIALERQSKYFDAVLAESLTEIDLEVIRQTSGSLVSALNEFEAQSGFLVECSPVIPGYQWISSGQGDFALGSTLIEVKCTSKNFGSTDYRQLLVYWLMSFAASLENKGAEWATGLLLNPRLNKYVEIDFNELIHFSAAGRSKLELLQLFDSLVSDQVMKLEI